MDPVLAGLSLLADPFSILLIFVGVLVGVVVGALPGLSSPMAVALLLPFTIGLPPLPSIASVRCMSTSVTRMLMATVDG